MLSWESDGDIRCTDHMTLGTIGDNMSSPGAEDKRSLSSQTLIRFRNSFSSNCSVKQSPAFTANMPTFTLLGKRMGNSFF